jgi:RND superfamily putative drug exporter
MLLCWVVLLVGALAASKVAGDAYSNSLSLPNTDSATALRLLQSRDAKAGGDQETIVWRSTLPGVKVTDATIAHPMSELLNKIATMADVASVTDPYTARGTGQISHDGRIAYARLDLTGSAWTADKTAVRNVIDTVRAVNSAAVEVQIGGAAVQKDQQRKPAAAEALGFVAALVVLLLAFGALVGALLPILTAIFGLGVGTSFIALVSHVTSLPNLAPIMAALIGMGVGIDYALFIVTRFRTGVRQGLSHEEAIVRALNSAGRAVLFAGGTVVIALLGLLTTGMGFIAGTGVGAAIAVATVVAAAITLLPALLGFPGIANRVLSRRERRRLREGGPVEPASSGLWSRWAGVVQRRPKLLALLAVAIMGVLIVPLFALRLGASDEGNDPGSTTTRKTYDMLADGFGPGFNGPLLMVAQLDSPGDAAAAAALAGTTATLPGVAAVHADKVAAGAKVAVIEVIPTTSPESAPTADLVDTLRGTVIPTAERGTTMHVHVGGATAVNRDFAAVVGARLPIFLVVVIGFGFLLLLAAFRSIAIPLSAAVMNLIAAGATFGFLVAVFQWGWGSAALGLGAAGPIDAYVPVMMLAILFGLSMDYQVFLVSRMHEEWIHSGDNQRAVRVGQAETGKVITAAATIMVCVFLSFLLTNQRGIAEFGFALAVAVLLDAFVLRMLLVPSIMGLLGRANWWIPNWLDRLLPMLSIEAGNTTARDTTAPDNPQSRPEVADRARVTSR